jgi:leucyl aminopeptidase
MFESLSVVAPQESADVLVLGRFKGEALDARSAKLDKSGVAAAASELAECSGDAGSIGEALATGAFKRVIVVGLGERAKFAPGAMRAVGAAVARRLAAIKATSAHMEVATAISSAAPTEDKSAKGKKKDDAPKIDLFACGSGVGEAFGLLAWVCDDFRGKATKKPERKALKISAGGTRFAQGVERGVALAVSANYCRTLSQTPPNVATPYYMADQAQKLAKQCKLGFKVWKDDDLAKDKCEGLINVGKASENKPCMIRLEYKPEGAKADDKPIVLIGKTMTYDSGGLSLKINNGMVGMKRDKDGGCAVLGAMHAIATLIKPKKRVVAYLCAAENSLSDEAYRPDDVLTYRNGVTVEVTNTDAEGRLVLADALCYTCDKDNPAFIVDLATLTGGVITALGSTYCGMFCDDDALRTKVEAAASASGERVWRLPMHEEYREMMKSPIADILNSNPNRKAHAGQGAAFLSYFVKEGTPWCHLDIAGVHVAEKNAGMFIDGPTGWGVRLLAELLDA